MASSVTVMSSNQHHLDRLDAARALLGVSPAPSTSGSSPNTSRLSTAKVSFAPRVQVQTTAQHSQESRFPLVAPTTQTRTVSFENPLGQPLVQPQVFQLAPPAVIRNGLDALAALASSEQACWEQARKEHQQQQQQKQQPKQRQVSSDDDDDDDAEAMPPPPPRGRRRSVSNPEGMEKWASPGRRDFVLPASILEEELAQASAAVRRERKNSVDSALAIVEEDEEEEEDEDEHTDGSTSPTPTTTSKAPISGLMSEEEQANLTPEELLKRARSRLLEDLSEGSLNGEKGVLTLPHSLSKYKDVYNKNGRIGIYTPAERAAIIARFNQKRARRVWNKKIRYNCRKNLADRRMRVKGRFVKRSTEQKARETTKKVVVKEDEDMPDVNDPEAGFCPTKDQPYRRTRRHTIT